MAGTWGFGQVLVLCVWVCGFCHAVPQWRNLPQQPQDLMFQQTDQKFQQPDQQQAKQPFPQQVQKQASQLFLQWVKQQANQQLPPFLKQLVQKLPQQVQEQASQQVQEQASQQLVQWVKQQANQQFQQPNSQQLPQWLKQLVQPVPQQDQEQASQILQWLNQLVQLCPGQVQEQASHIPLWLKQLAQELPQLVQPCPQTVQEQAGHQFPQTVKQPAQQTGHQFPQWVKQPDQQAGKLFPQWVKQGSKFPQPDQPKPPGLEPVPLDKCDVADNEQIQCGPPGISGAECDAINCCFNGQQCYYGKAVTVQCVRDGQFVVVVARDVTLPRLSLDSVHLLGGNDPPCSPVQSTASFAIFQFPVTACGTSVMEESGFVVYENRMISSYEVGLGPLGSITRDSHFELLFQCRYSDTSVEALVVEVKTVPAPPPVVSPGPLRVELRLANGQCVTRGCAEGDEAYTSYYSEADYPVTKVLQEPVYVEVRVLERTNPNIVLILGRCWATSTPSPLSLPQWDLLVDGCPYQDDRYLTTLVPVTGQSGLQFPTHYKRFVVKMFSFVDPVSLAPLQETIFIHCSTEVCHPSSGSCEQRCTRKRRDTNVKTSSTGKIVVSSREVNLVT